MALVGKLQCLDVGEHVGDAAVRTTDTRHRIAAAAGAGDRVVRLVATVVGDVGTRPAVQGVGAQPAGDAVIAAQTVDDVPPTPAARVTVTADRLDP